MRVVFSSVAYDPLGVIELEINPEDSDFGEDRRRVNRIATLNGGVVFNDFGFTHGDKTITLSWRSKDVESENLVSRLVRLYNYANVFLPTGVFTAGIQNYSLKGDSSNITFLVKSKLSED